MSNGETYKNQESICIKLETFLGAGFNLTNRYTDTCADSVKASVQNTAVNIDNFLTQYYQLIDDMIGTNGQVCNGLDCNEQANSDSASLLSLFEQASLNFENLNSKLYNVNGFVNAFNGGLEG